jgi:4-diphosphocytidyl-2-C-methyl-D-erythritol kinase
MVMQAVDLCDEITVELFDGEGICITSDSPNVPCNESNIAYRAAQIMLSKAGVARGVKIHISKRIPVCAGLAGGSSDGAAVIMGLNAMFGTMLKPAEMYALGERVGADVPFCIAGGTKLCTGIGTTMKKLPSFNCSDIVICKPQTVSVSTAEAYQKVDALNPHPSYTDEMIKALYSRDMFLISSTFFNDFELALQIPEVSEIKRVMLQCKARGCGMSGSGSAVFAIFTSSRRAQKCYETLKETYPQTFLCKPVKIGCAVE